MQKYLLGILLASAAMVNAQMLAIPEESQLGTVTQEIAFTEIEIKYSRPNIKGRDLFGSMIPWNSVWRLGANASTKISTTRDIFLEENRLPKGTYSALAIPQQIGKWTIIINKDTTLWGHYGYDESKDLFRCSVDVVTSDQFYETFTITFDEVESKHATINVHWGNIRIPIAIKVDEKDFDNEMTASIDAMLEKPLDHDKPVIVAHSYLRAANYYSDTGRDLEKALAFANQAVALSQVNYFYLYQSEILGKLKRYDEAIAASRIGYAMFDKNGTGKNKEWIWRYAQQIEKWNSLKRKQ